ncbi:MAG: hypothetical protein LBK71_06115 [Verrucomicrobiales bacterium]|nr:hypothetical protein [Verrucomicrobiales bacterium]
MPVPKSRPNCMSKNALNWNEIGYGINFSKAGNPVLVGQIHRSGHRANSAKKPEYARPILCPAHVEKAGGAFGVAGSRAGGN